MTQDGKSRKSKHWEGAVGRPQGLRGGLCQACLVTVTAVSKCCTDRNPLQGSLPQPTASVDSKPHYCQFSLQLGRGSLEEGGRCRSGTTQKGVFV